MGDPRSRPLTSPTGIWAENPRQSGAQVRRPRPRDSPSSFCSPGPCWASEGLGPASAISAAGTPGAPRQSLTLRPRTSAARFGCCWDLEQRGPGSQWQRGSAGAATNQRAPHAPPQSEHSAGKVRGGAAMGRVLVGFPSHPASVSSACWGGLPPAEEQAQTVPFRWVCTCVWWGLIPFRSRGVILPIPTSWLSFRAKRSHGDP